MTQKTEETMVDKYRWGPVHSYRSYVDDEGNENDSDKGVAEEIIGYDWYHAFKAATEGGIDRQDVAKVLHLVEGEHDGPDWVGIFELKDGRILYVSAGCDYTGWDCQSSGVADWRPTLDEVVRELCTDDDRQRLGLSLPDDARQETQES